MEVGAIIISMVAVAVAGFAVWFQWKMYQASTGQLGEARNVLSKLEGVSLQLRDTQEKQFSELLGAVVGMVKKDTGEAVTRLEERVAELESSGADLEGVKEAVEAFKRDVEKPPVPALRFSPSVLSDWGGDKYVTVPGTATLVRVEDEGDEEEEEEGDGDEEGED